MTRRLVVKPFGGLGNRLLAMASAARLADQLGCELALQWDQDIEMVNPFSDLFVPDVRLVSNEETGRCHLYDLMKGGFFVDLDEMSRHDEVKLAAFSLILTTGDNPDPMRDVF